MEWEELINKVLENPKEVTRKEILTLIESFSPSFNGNDIPISKELMSSIRESLRHNQVRKSEWPVWIDTSKSKTTLNMLEYFMDEIGEFCGLNESDTNLFNKLIDELSYAKSPGKSLKEAKKFIRHIKESYKKGKREGDLIYPHYCYAVVGDVVNPDTWEHRIFESDRTVNKAGMDKTIRYLKHICEGTDIDKSLSIKASRIKDILSKALFIDSVKSNKIYCNDFTTIREAKSSSRGRVPIVVIQPGITSDGMRFYPAETLAEAFPLYEGVKMFVNHETDNDLMERPEGDINKWVGIVENVRLGKGGEILADAVIIDPEFKEKIELFDAQSKLSKLGISHHSIGDFEFQDVNGKELMVITKIEGVRSVDFVTEANAGGKALMLEAFQPQYDVDLLTVEQLKKRRPDLVNSFTESNKTKRKTNMDTEEKVKELEGDIKGIKESLNILIGKKEETTKEETALLEAEKTKYAELEKKNQVLESKSKFAEAIDKDKDLPDSAKEHLKGKFAESIFNDDTTKELENEVKFLKSLLESSKGNSEETGSGETHPIGSEEDEEESKELFESYKKTFLGKGMSEEEATKEAKQRIAV